MNALCFKLPLAVCGFLFAFSAPAQTNFTEKKAGHQYYISMPDYMSKTLGLNDAASAQYKNTVKEAYVIVIDDSKEELDIVHMRFSGAEDFYESFADGFLADQKKRKIGKPTTTTVGDVKFVQTEASYYDEDAKMKVNYFVTIAETKTHFYKILCWTDDKNKDRLRADYNKIALSLRD
jgi:hypothetical protein